MLFGGQNCFNSLPRDLFFTRTTWRIGWISPGWLSTSKRGKELNKFFPPDSSEDLCLFKLYLSFSSSVGSGGGSGGVCQHRLVEVHLHENTHSVLINGHDTDQPLLEAASSLPKQLLLDVSTSPTRHNGYAETHFWEDTPERERGLVTTKTVAAGHSGEFSDNAKTITTMTKMQWN